MCFWAGGGRAGELAAAPGREHAGEPKAKEAAQGLEGKSVSKGNLFWFIHSKLLIVTSNETLFASSLEKKLKI